VKRNRLRASVRRTVLFGLITYSLTVLWYARHSHDPAQIADERARGPWYTTKTESSFQDMVIKLRRVIIAARLQRPGPYKPRPKKPAPCSWPGPQPKHDHQKSKSRGPG